MFKKYFVPLLIAASLLTACQPAPGAKVVVEGGSYRVVTFSELQAMLENKDFVMINVHTPWEGDIPQTDLRLPYNEIEQSLSQIPEARDAKLVIYCLTSGMAKKAVATLLSQGYTNLWMLEGGTTAWQEAGLTLSQE